MEARLLSGPLEARQCEGCGAAGDMGLLRATHTLFCAPPRVGGVCGHVNPAASHHLPACSLVRLHSTHTVPGISRNQRSMGAFQTHVSASSSRRDHPSCAHQLLVSLPGGPEGAGNPCRLRNVYKRPPCTRNCARCLTNVIVFITNITIV